MAKRMKFRVRRDERRERAQHLAEARANRSDQQQLDRLDSILGAGVGASKEREKLTARIRSAKS